MSSDWRDRLREIEQQILRRRPEHSINPSLDRIRELVTLLGDPQRAYPVIHITGTNGKTLDGADDRDAAARPGPAHRAVHQPAPGPCASGSTWTASR